MGRSVSRQVRIAVSEGRPSRLKKPPGILPAAYIRSSNSTVSGKKSIPSRGELDDTAVASTTVSPYRIRTAPSARPAIRPVSSEMVRPANSVEKVSAAIQNAPLTRGRGQQGRDLVQGGSPPPKTADLDAVRGNAVAWAG